MSRMPKAANGTNLGVLIGRNIKLARAQQGWTQGELVEAIGVETVTISRIETGAQHPSISRLQQIAGVLGTSLAALVADAGENSDTLVLLAEALKGLPPREQDFVRSFAVTYSLHWKAGQVQWVR